MTSIGAEHDTLARVTSELVQVGPEQEQSEILWEVLEEDSLEILWKNDLGVIAPGSFPFQNYYSKWPWNELAINTQRTLPRGERALEVFPERDWWYWEDQLDWLADHPDLISDGDSIEELRRISKDAESKYFGFVEEWTSRRIELENELFDCSLRLQIFRRDLLAALDSLKSPFFDSPGWLFIREYWDLVIAALDRYFRTAGCNDSKVLTHSSRRKIRNRANALLQSLDEALDDLPPEFEPDYEKLAYQLRYFLKEFDSQLTPLRAHPKVARQILLRELLLAWKNCACRVLMKCSPPISPVRHVLNIVSVVDDSISERDVHREYALIRGDNTGKVDR